MQWQQPRGPVEQAASFFFDSSTQQEEVVGRLFSVQVISSGRIYKGTLSTTILYYVYSTVLY